ncbi:MAG: aldolase catalytic domain-containing protein [Lachnospiraceae bacterium]|nr:aldolase catalytic domain-containing protein [Lachnospiraceae bacterium]
MDVTLRDGGLINNFKFSDNFVSALYKANCEAGIDIMEFGYKASKRLYSPEEYGKWKFCDEESIRNVVKDVDKNMMISVMADVGRTDYKQDIIEKRESIIDMIRVATYSKDMNEAIHMIQYIKERGYYVTCNIMAISTDSEQTIRNALDVVVKSDVDGVYVVDSYGALYPDDITYLTKLFMEYTQKYEKVVGIHAHNNQQMAFANTVTALHNGARLLDVSVNGMGRGAGNCMMELLVAYLREANYRIEPILDFLAKEMNPLKQQGIQWGYDTMYLISGMLNQHPRTAISLLNGTQQNYVDYYNDMVEGE